jgi:flagellar basal body rod protein FlgG
MAINQHKQDVVANNLANVDTTGFKRDLAVFQERMPEALAAGKEQFMPSNLRNSAGGIFVSETQTDLSAGGMEVTNRNLDVAINGNGFFMVQDGEETRFTRDGRLGVVEGRLVREVDGKPILDDQGRTITVPDVSLRDIQISSDGTIRANGEEFAKLGVADFENPQKLRKVGANLFSAEGQDYGIVETPLTAEAIEMSTVNPARELVDMIKVSRNFQLNAEMLTLQDQTLARLMSELPKV